MTGRRRITRAGIILRVCETSASSAAKNSLRRFLPPPPMKLSTVLPESAVRVTEPSPFSSGREVWTVQTPLSPSDRPSYKFEFLPSFTPYLFPSPCAAAACIAGASDFFSAAAALVFPHISRSRTDRRPRVKVEKGKLLPDGWRKDGQSYVVRSRCP